MEITANCQHASIFTISSTKKFEINLIKQVDWVRLKKKMLKFGG
uniref:Uncharacterized protein n=1 Tax=Meloidogyne enterolobii TaxID=390850 RepID=A0A6V7X829_MELEN|nr:unnamed protein product [Meloidogyne enterolobii]